MTNKTKPKSRVLRLCQRAAVRCHFSHLSQAKLSPNHMFCEAFPVRHVNGVQIWPLVRVFFGTIFGHLSGLAFGAFLGRLAPQNLRFRKGRPSKKVCKKRCLQEVMLETRKKTEKAAKATPKSAPKNKKNGTRKWCPKKGGSCMSKKAYRSAKAPKFSSLQGSLMYADRSAKLGTDMKQPYIDTRIKLLK